MRAVLTFLLLLATGPTAAADGSVTVPWAEFRQLFTEQLRQSLLPDAAEETPAVYTIDRADYELRILDDGVEGRVTLDGRVLAGHPDPIPVFADDVAVTAIDSAQGATLIGLPRGYGLFLDTQDRFSLVLRIAAPLAEERSARRLSFGIPAAVRNSLSLDTQDRWRLLDSPGLRPSDDRYFFAPSRSLTLRLVRLREMGAAPPPVVDSFSQIALRGDRYLITTWFAPTPGSSSVFEIRLPPDARLVDSSIGTDRVHDAGSGSLTVTLPEDRREVFHVRFELAATEPGTRIHLPVIPGNLGREREFRLEQPDDALIAVAGSGHRRGLDQRRLPQPIRASLDTPVPYLRAPESGEIELLLTRFDRITAPEIVLDTVHLYTSFTDNGRSLSVLRLTLPPEAGDKLILDAVPGSEVWSLRVNGMTRRLYGQSAQRWVVPLERDGPSAVELAYLLKGERLGLEGRLELRMPGTGIAARRLHAAIGLAERVDLIAMEGDLEPAEESEWPQVREFTGSAYHFVQPYFGGGALTAAVFYREPVQPQPRP
jgi:hypothetical protein